MEWKSELCTSIYICEDNVTTFLVIREFMMNTFFLMYGKSYHTIDESTTPRGNTLKPAILRETVLDSIINISTYQLDSILRFRQKEVFYLSSSEWKSKLPPY